MNVRLTASLGDIDQKTQYYVKVIYPYNLVLPKPVKMNGQLSLNLDGYEVLSAELIPAKDIDKSLPVGVRYSVKDGRLFVFGRPGEEKRIESVGRKNLGVVRFGKTTEELAWKVKSQVGSDEILPAKPYPSTIRKEIIPISHYSMK